jgi:hypothetical protein
MHFVKNVQIIINTIYAIIQMLSYLSKTVTKAYKASKKALLT